MTDKTEIKIDSEFSPLILSLGQYELFMAGGRKGMEALGVFLHLMYTARRQHTNQVYAVNTYIQRGTGLSREKVQAAKKFLIKNEMIEKVTRKDSQGKIIGHYIKLKYIHRKTTIESTLSHLPESRHMDKNHTTGFPPAGYQQQMLKVNNINALNKKGEGPESESI